MAINLTLNDFRSVLGNVNDGNIVLKQDQSGIEKANYGNKFLNLFRCKNHIDSMNSACRYIQNKLHIEYQFFHLRHKLDKRL